MYSDVSLYTDKSKQGACGQFPIELYQRTEWMQFNFLKKLNKTNSDEKKNILLNDIFSLNKFKRK